MQMLLETSAPDYAAWKSAFDAAGEDIGAAGLSPLQIWRAEGNAVLILMQVADRKRAQDWLAIQSGFGRGYSARFLETA